MEHTYICLMPIITEMPKEKTRNNLKKYADPRIRKNVCYSHGSN